MESDTLNLVFEAIGFNKELDVCLFLCKSAGRVNNALLKFQLNKAADLGAKAVFFRNESGGYHNPQICVYDASQQFLDERSIIALQKKVWSSGFAPLMCVYDEKEIKIIDCTRHSEKSRIPTLYTVSLNDPTTITEEVKQFAAKVKTGVFWEEHDNMPSLSFRDGSAYFVMVCWARMLRDLHLLEAKSVQPIYCDRMVARVLIIRYLEERKDEDGSYPFRDKYYSQIDGVKSLDDVLSNNDKFIALLNDLSADFGDSLFGIEDAEMGFLQHTDLSFIRKAIGGFEKVSIFEEHVINRITNIDFACLPVETICKALSEVAYEENRQKTLSAVDANRYTSTHAAKIAIDEVMPIDKHNEFDPAQYQMIDPACGTGIFLVTAFKRLVQWWKLRNNYRQPSAGDLQNLIQCIHGVDDDERLLNMASYALWLTVCSELPIRQLVDSPKAFHSAIKNQLLFTNLLIEEFVSPLVITDPNEARLLNEKMENYQRLMEMKFDLIVGNVAFLENGLAPSRDDSLWTTQIKRRAVTVQPRHISMLLFAKMLKLMKPSGVHCLFARSDMMLYNPHCEKYMEALFAKYCVSKVLDFTQLDESFVLWDSEMGLETFAMLVENRVADPDLDLQHWVFRQSRLTAERISFEVEMSDRYTIDRASVSSKIYVWKSNILGGGRIRAIMDLMSVLPVLSSISEQFTFVTGENSTKSMDNRCFCRTHVNEDYITSEYLKSFSYSDDFDFSRISIIIKKNIELCFAFNFSRMPYPSDVMAILPRNEKNDSELSEVWNCINKNHTIMSFHIIVSTTYAALCNKTPMEDGDIFNLPYTNENIIDKLSTHDKKVIEEVINQSQQGLFKGREPEISKFVPERCVMNMATFYGKEMSRIFNSLNRWYNEQFDIRHVVLLYGGTYIAMIFDSSESVESPIYHNGWNDQIDDNITFDQIEAAMSRARVSHIRRGGTIVCIKPNQQRYWTCVMASKDAETLFRGE